MINLFYNAIPKPAGNEELITHSSNKTRTNILSLGWLDGTNSKGVKMLNKKDLDEGGGFSQREEEIRHPKRMSEKYSQLINGQKTVLARKFLNI